MFAREQGGLPHVLWLRRRHVGAVSTHLHRWKLFDHELVCLLPTFVLHFLARLYTSCCNCNEIDRFWSVSAHRDQHADDNKDISQLQKL